MPANEAPQPGHAMSSAEPFNNIDDSELLSVTVHQPDRAVWIIHVAGELDMLTSPSLHNHLSRLFVTRPDRLIIDLSQVSFLGSAGLQVLLDARRAANQQATTLQLSGTTHHAVARPLTITGVDYLFEIVPPATE
ncbi:MAG: STAS domain-containing protein [Pseudonocardiales bacterium]|nr:STAS domain-containing protein [Pseudonocardiales bacterium]